MTAFGRGQNSAREATWTVEIRTVNSRFLDFHLKIPPMINCLEERVKKLVSARLTRGRVNLSITLTGLLDTKPKLILNRPLVREYRRVLDELREELGMDADPGLGAFLANRDLIRAEDSTPDADELMAQVAPAVNQALDSLMEMRDVEGATLAADFRERLDLLAVLFKKVGEASPAIAESYRQRLQERLAILLGDVQPDPERIAQEVAIIADKSDITEETVRAASHLEQFKSMLEMDQPVGRKLDFLIQELNREANTMGSKSPDAAIAQLIVEIKTELERLREQVQNVE